MKNRKENKEHIELHLFTVFTNINNLVGHKN